MNWEPSLRYYVALALLDLDEMENFQESKLQRSKSTDIQGITI